ncbi:ABC transporter permease [Nitratireductor aestuarii]|uniref:ABC transporter permease n=1 Tax=Nitratireductor aestuarii TaxID=1735103 RepID=A0A916RRJ2_9HYPH|nr:iron ABC transporter permease [Nitratireductor aestuarii]GGA67717.1 ABC transporter permease [Nitratireductor aestuarii]
MRKATWRSGALWLIVAGFTAFAVLLPFLALAFEALQGSEGLWGHLFSTILPVALRDTLILLSGVGIFVAMLGTGAAWLVTAYDFPGRRTLEWALLLPLAVPTYIVAYTYLDILHPIGVVQGTIRTLLGYSSPREFRLPDIRSMAGCILVLSFVLYPYVYIATRSMFLTQPGSLIEAARTLGVSRRAVFWRVALPLARPAVAVGISLALMETLNDIGAAEFLGVRTLTVSIYTTWITRSDLPGASQIALSLLVVVMAIVALEQYARRRQRFAAGTRSGRSFDRQRVSLPVGLALLGLGLIPVLIGFAGPALYLATEAYARLGFAGIPPRFVSIVTATVVFSAAATLMTLALGGAAAYAVRVRSCGFSTTAFRLSAVGYAAPGTVIAIGLVVVLGAFDRTANAYAQSWFGFSTGLIFLGSGAALVYAYSARFMAISSGGMAAALSRIPHSLDEVSRTLGESPSGTLRRVHLPLSKTGIAAAALLVFVDCVKELPATLLLRPLNVETLATHLYGEAARGTYEDASISALAIVLIAMLPVVLLSRVGSERNLRRDVLVPTPLEQLPLQQQAG